MKKKKKAEELRSAIEWVHSLPKIPDSGEVEFEYKRKDLRAFISKIPIPATDSRGVGGLYKASLLEIHDVHDIASDERIPITRQIRARILSELKKQDNDPDLVTSLEQVIESGVQTGYTIDLKYKNSTLIVSCDFGLDKRDTICIVDVEVIDRNTGAIVELTPELKDNISKEINSDLKRRSGLGLDATRQDAISLLRILHKAEIK